MSFSTFRCLCERVGATGKWLVLCLRCPNEIGTMSSELLREAVYRTAHKGGVLCPECREKACRFCGVELELSCAYPGEIEQGYCTFCEVEERHKTHADCVHGFKQTIREFQAGFERCPACEMEEAVRRMTQSPACLVSHISSPEENLVSGGTLK